MATTLYLRAAAPAYHYLIDKVPVDNSTTWAVDRATTGTRSVVDQLDMSTSAGSASSSIQIPTVAGPHASFGVRAATWVSQPLAADITVSGTIAVDIWAYESSMSANVALYGYLYRVQADGTVTNIGGFSSYGTELGTSAAQSSWTITPTSTALQAGDILQFVVYLDDATSTNQGAGYYAYILGDGLEGGTGDSQIRFTETLTFDSTSFSGTTLYLLDAASDVSGAGKKKLWTDGAGVVADKVVNTVAAPNFAQWTDSAGGQVLEWITPPLKAVTLTGPFTYSGLAGQSNTNARVSPLIRVYKAANDGTVGALIGQGRPNVALGIAPNVLGYGLYGFIKGALADGERIVVRVYTSSYLNSTALTSQASGYTATIELNNAGSERFRIQLLDQTLQRYGPAASTLVDNFTTKDTTRWNWGTNDVSGGKAQVAVGTFVKSNGLYSIAESSICVDWSNVQSIGKKFLIWSTDADTTPFSRALYLALDAGSQYLIGGYSDTNGNNVVEQHAYPFDISTMKYARIHQTGTNVYWEYSSDATSWLTVTTTAVASILSYWGGTNPMDAGNVLLYTNSTDAEFGGINALPEVTGPAPTDYWGVAA